MIITSSSGAQPFAGFCKTREVAQPTVEAFSTGSGGLHPWAQALYSHDIASQGPRCVAQGYLSALVRPIDLTLEIYEGHGATPPDVHEIRRVLERRRAAWQARL